MSQVLSLMYRVWNRMLPLFATVAEVGLGNLRIVEARVIRCFTRRCS